MFKKPFVIAEIGSNWRDKETALQQISMAKKAGADAVKFQYFTHKSLYGFDSNDLIKWELPRDLIPELKAACDLAHIEFICTAFSLEDYDYINQFVNIHKIAAPESGWDDLVRHVLKYKKHVIISREIKNRDWPKYISRSKLHSIQTISRYPAVSEDYDFCSYPWNWYRFEGVSDHTRSFQLIAPTLKKLLRSGIFEVHVDLIGGTKTPDTCVSLNYNEFKEYVDRIRNPDKYYLPKPDYSRRETKYGFFRPK